MCVSWKMEPMAPPVNVVRRGALWPLLSQRASLLGSNLLFCLGLSSSQTGGMMGGQDGPSEMSVKDVVGGYVGAGEPCVGPGRQGLHVHSSPVAALSTNEFPSPSLPASSRVRPPAPEQSLAAAPSPERRRRLGQRAAGSPGLVGPSCLLLLTQPHSHHTDHSNTWHLASPGWHPPGGWPLESTRPRPQPDTTAATSQGQRLQGMTSCTGSLAVQPPSTRTWP